MTLPARPTGWAWFGHLLETGFFCAVHCPHYRRRPERYRAWDCPRCGIQVEQTLLMTEEQWQEWCRTNGGCRRRDPVAATSPAG